MQQQLEQESAGGRHRELVAFRAAGQDFCIDIMAVREIRGWSPATSLPHAPDFVCGVINLRGSVVPIVDLSVRLGKGPLQQSERNVIIISIIDTQVIGILVEAVFDILSVPESAIQETPDVGKEKARTLIDGIFTEGERMVRLIDLDKLLPQQEKSAA